MTAIKISAAAAALVLGLSGAAFAQAGTPESHGTNAAGSKSGVVGKGDSRETGPATTGTATAPGGAMPANPGMSSPGTSGAGMSSTGMSGAGMSTSEPGMAPKPTSPAPGAR